MSAAYALMFCRLALAATFAWSAGGKLRDMRAFRDSITAFRLLPRRWSAPLGWAFVGGEAAVVVLLLLGQPPLLGAAFGLAAGLLLIFSGALLSVMRRALAVSCNCFGRTEQQVSWYDLVRNALLLGCCLGGGWALPAASAALTGGETMLLGIMALCFLVLVTHVGDIVETLRRPFEIQ